MDEKTAGPRAYQRKEDTDGATLKVRAATVRFLSREGAEGSAAAATAPPAVTGAEPITEEELPF